MIRRCIRLVGCLMLIVASTAQADEWRGDWHGTFYGYGNRTLLNGNSLLNPGNGLARLPEESNIGELRFDINAGSDRLRVDARPIATVEESRNGFGTTRNSDLYLSRWRARARLDEHWSVVAGREVMNWGPAQFRSPSSPFYFDSGKSDPVRELTGMDMAKLAWTPVMQVNMSLAWIIGNGDSAATSDPWRQSLLYKFDLRMDDWAYGLAVVRKPGVPLFFGLHTQKTLDEMWMIYGEYSSAALAELPASNRKSTWLGGAAYTFDNGQTLNLEWLHDDHGLKDPQRADLFQLARTIPGAALSAMPRLLGRDYLHLVWQSNLMESSGYWRLMATRNLTDNASTLAGYGELTFTDRISGFAIAYWNFGNADQEAAALIRGSLSAGIKVAMP